MKAKSIIFSILCIFITSFALAQINKFPMQVKNNLQNRIDFEILRTKDPKTGKIPKNIRMKELKFMRDQQKNLGIPLVLGDVYTTWNNRGPHNVGGRTRALAVDILNENIILAGGVSGGIWRSTDGGTSWSKTTGNDELQSVSCIAQDPRTGHTSTWYYGTGEIFGNSTSGVGAIYRGDGIYKSIDNGLTWTILSTTSTNQPEILNRPFDFNHEIVVNPVNGYVLVANYGGIYQSTDGGTSFSQVIINNSDGDNWSDVVISSRGFAYAAIDDQGIFSSPDGVTWTNISPPSVDYPLVAGERKELALAASNENILYVLGEDISDVSGHSLWHFDESTDIWTDRSINIPNRSPANISQFRVFATDFDSQGGYNLLIKVKPDDENFVIVGGINLIRSTNGFVNMDSIDLIGSYKYFNQHANQHAFVFLSGNKALSGNSGGVQITNDITNDIRLPGRSEKVDWTSLNNGYLTTQVYAVSAGPGEQIMAGFQGNGTWITTSTSGTADWTEQFGGDGGYNAFNSNGTVRFVSGQNARIFRLNYNRGANDIVADDSIYFTPDSYMTSLFITPFYLDPQNDNLFYLGGNADFYVNTQANLVGSSNTGWKSIALPMISTGSYVSEIGVTMSNSVYVGTSRGKVYKVTNPGDTASVSFDVSEITGTNFPVGYVSGIAINPFILDEILVTFSNYSIPSVFYSNNGGTSWTDVSGSLEQNSDGTGSGSSVRTVAIVGNGDRYFVGTSTGLYSTNSLSGSTTMWLQEDSNGIGNVVVEHVISRASDGLVVAGTHGNGIYSAKFETSAPNIELAVTEITAPNSRILSAIESITATIENRGSADQIGFTISLIINGTSIVSDLINTTLMVGTSASYTFSQTFDFSGLRDYNVEVRVNQLGDVNTFNNSFTKKILNIKLISSFPYSESFEDATHGWSTPGTLWELGTPATTGIIGASNGTQAWATDLDAKYPNNALEMLESPVFDFSSLSNPFISFDINYATEPNYDGLYLAYRIDLNAEYTPLLVTEISNWYNSTINGRFGSPVWGGTTNGNYINARASFASLKNQSVVQLALIFSSDRSTKGEGIAIDAFNIRNRLTNDLAVTAINSPLHLLFSRKTTTTIINFGTVTENSYDLSYYVNNIRIANEHITTAINPKSSIEHTFAVPYDFSAAGTYNIRVAVNSPEDTNASNDTLSINSKSFAIISTFPYLETFDNDMGSLPSKWENVGTSSYNWLVNRGSTPTSATGPSGDNTTGSGYYVYTEAISSNQGDTTLLLSPAFNLDGLIDPHLQFFYHMYGIDMGSLDVLVEQENGTITNVFRITGQQHAQNLDPFTSSRNISLTAFLNQRIRLIFKGTRRFRNRGDIAIDDVSIFKVINNDLSVTAITAPDNLVAGLESITTRITNIGLMPQSNFDITYFVNSEMIFTETISESLAFEAAVTHTFTRQFDFSAIDNYTLRVVVNLSGDENPDNDSLTKNVSNVNDSPTRVILSGDNSISENALIGTVVGMLSTIDADTRDIHTYTLTGTDAASLSIGGTDKNELRSAEMFDFETKSSYDITITATDAGRLTVDRDFTINVTDTNDAPTSLTLSNNSIIENVTIGTVVGTLSTRDIDAEDMHTYTISGTDAAGFMIGGTGNNELQSTEMFDFETKSSHDIIITAIDIGNLMFAQDFTINITNTNDAPTDLTLINNSIIENANTGTIVGMLSTVDADAGDAHTYIITGIDAASFSIGGTGNNELQSAEMFDFETKSNYTIRIITRDIRGLTFSQNFMINVTDVNEIPTGLSININSIAENLPANTIVGTFSTVDEDISDSHTYTLVTGTGDDDNNSFNISGRQLQTSIMFDFETKNSYTIRVNTNDGHGGNFEIPLVITILDVDETINNQSPTAIDLSLSAISENEPINTILGTLSTTDPNPTNTHTYTVVFGNIDDFTIVGNELSSSVSFNFEVKSDYSIGIRTTDNNLAIFDQIFNITINDVNDSPTRVILSGDNSISENTLIGTIVGMLSAVDEDAGDAHTYTLTGTDAASFRIGGTGNDELQNAIVFDFENKSSYDITIIAKDAGGLTVARDFIINVTDVNDAPTSVTLSNNSIIENATIGTVVGTLSTMDIDAGDMHTYTITGADATSFMIGIAGNNELQSAEMFDFETKSSYGITIIATDAGGLNATQDFTINVTGVNESPTSVILSKDSIAENANIGTLVGMLSAMDPDIGDTHTYAISGTDAASFSIGGIGDELQSAAVFDFETKYSYTITITAMDTERLTISQDFTINVTDVNEVPTGLSINMSSIAENLPANTIVGTFSTVDEDISDSYTYTLVIGMGDDDNGSFNIPGRQLQTSIMFDFETKNSYTIRVNTNDGHGGNFEIPLVITILDVDETINNQSPTAIDLSLSAISENEPINTILGTLSTTDLNLADTHKYTIISGDIDDFTIAGNELRSSVSFNFELKSNYSIGIRTTDNNLAIFNQTFNITINDINESPTALTLSNNSIVENANIGTVVGMLSAIDADAGDTHTYTISGADAASFSIGGTYNNELRSTEVFVFNTKPSYDITITTADSEGLTFSQNFTINISNTNESPTSVTLSNNRIVENASIGTVVGTLSTMDINAVDMHTYAISGTDATGFMIGGTGNNELQQSTNSFDFETKSSYVITITAIDIGNLMFAQDFMINVTNVNEAPTNLALSNNSIAENAVIGTVVGMLSTQDVDVGDAHTYTISGTDAASFRIVGTGTGNNELQSAIVFNFETKSSHDIIITAMDAERLTISQDFTITVTNVNEAPTRVELIGNGNIAENLPVNTVVGILSTVDEDTRDTHTYTISGTDAASFSIGGTGTGNNELQSTSSFDFETKSNYAITVTATDAGRLSATQDFTINVTNVNESPTNLVLSNNSIAENEPIRTVVGMLSAMDVDAGDMHTYAISGTDATSFSIGGTGNNELQSTEVFVFNTKSSYTVTITATDVGGLTATQDFTINITSTTGIDNPNNRLFHVYPNPSKGHITIAFDAILKDANWNLYDLTGKALLTKSKPINELETNVDITHLSDGIYLLKITNNDRQITKQISIVR